jgi:hypothetical protein
MADTASKGSTNNTILVSVLGGVEIGLIALVGYFLTQLTGNPDTANNLTKTVLPITGTLAAIVLLHTALWYFYFIYNPLSMNLYLLLSTSMNTIICLLALSIALTTQRP